MLKFPLSPFCSVSQGFTVQTVLELNFPPASAPEHWACRHTLTMPGFFLYTCHMSHTKYSFVTLWAISYISSLQPVMMAHTYYWSTRLGGWGRRSSKNLRSACARWLIPGKFWLYSYTMRFWIKFYYMLFILHVSMCLYAHATAYMSEKDNCGNGFSPTTVQALEKKYSHQAWHQVVLMSYLPRPRIKNCKGAEEVTQ